MDRQRWVDAVIAFRFYKSRAKNLSLAKCVRAVYRDYTGSDPDAHVENEVYVIASVVEVVLAQGDAGYRVFDVIREAWKNLTSADIPRGLVAVMARSIWLAESERQTLGGRYGKQPSDGCKAIGIHRDDISPWQENAIRALEDDANEH